MALVGTRIEYQLRGMVLALFALLLLLAVVALIPRPTVTIGDAWRELAPLSVRAGTRVTWLYRGAEPRQLRIVPTSGPAAEPHRIERLDWSRPLQAGSRWSYRFTAPGVYAVYLASPERSQQLGTVTVTR